METVIAATVVASLIGVALGVLIGYMDRKFGVESDPRVEEVAGMLPGANCGACGLAGCTDMARAIVAAKKGPEDCPVCSVDAAARIASLLGRTASARVRQVAVVLCGGSNSRASKSAEYNGVSDCRSASLVGGGGKSCKHGCLGYASCARACPFGAIEMRDGLAIVHSDICTGCGKCVDTCPRKLIKLVPATAKVSVYCSSPEKGPVKKKFCSVPCIGCRKCVKASDEGQMLVNGFLVQVNYANPPSEEIVAKAACPTGCLMTADAMQSAEGRKEAVA